MNKLVSFLLILGLACWAQAYSNSPALPGYYGAAFYNDFSHGQLHNENLLDRLNKILNGGHIINVSGYDQIVDDCNHQPNCISSSSINMTYKEARTYLFGRLHLDFINGLYALTDVYCMFTYTQQHTSIGPDQIPSVDYLNTEHTWPQSRFTNRYSKEVQKTDLHHLYPTDTQMNSKRSSLHFGDVVQEVEELKCSLSKLGHSANGGIVFEPPDNHKGNVARAIFYFATRYDMKISPREEAALREWHQQDPVDAFEYQRNEEIYKLQNVRNPFIDFPELVNYISVFN